MRNNTTLFLLLTVVFLFSTSLLQGCAGVVVGGAATGAAVIHDRRTSGTVIDDEIIEFKVIDRMMKNTALNEKTHINATSYNNVLLLTGEAPTEELKQEVYDLLKTIPNVKRVHNEITVAAPSAYLSRSSDTWITAKVKTLMLKIDDIKGFDPTRVKIVSENGTVYLMGLVTRAEGDAVTDVARKVDGVQRVVKVFEYIE